jgi:hypothetical protein
MKPEHMTREQLIEDNRALLRMVEKLKAEIVKSLEAIAKHYEETRKP